MYISCLRIFTNRYTFCLCLLRFVMQTYTAFWPAGNQPNAVFSIGKTLIKS
jgi:amino acid permease